MNRERCIDDDDDRSAEWRPADRLTNWLATDGLTNWRPLADDECPLCLEFERARRDGLDEGHGNAGSRDAAMQDAR